MKSYGLLFYQGFILAFSTNTKYLSFQNLYTLSMLQISFSAPKQKMVTQLLNFPNLLENVIYANSRKELIKTLDQGTGSKAPDFKIF